MNLLATIAARAAKDQLPFLVAGEHAVIAHGHRRNTFDLDLIIRREDRDSWLRLMEQLGYALYREGPTFMQLDPGKAGPLPIDLMFVNADTFAKMMADAVAGPASALEARIVSLLHLLALKCHAIKHGHPRRVVKDADDVIRLVEANRLNMNDPGVRELFLKHGTPDLYEKTRRLCSAD